MLLFHAPKNLVFVDTINLDGEMGVKQKYPFTQGIDMNNIQFMQGVIRSTVPNPDLEHWNGKITFNERQSEKLDSNNLMLRGSILRKTSYCMGLIIYVGTDTKINQNVQKIKVKDSWLLQTTNRLLYALFVFLALLVTIFSGAKVDFDKKNFKLHLNNQTDGTAHLKALDITGQIIDQ